ncbi:MAG TPA: ribonuclease H-like domain-containing protein [Myxococcota bacterium]|nr:ribonuclease H-like domain-containing protein [Myxococcota bacterium]HOD07721.1 ribonuclease H-like domain-containing protein [Myxococcota bacterium]HPB49826.1 ribonuclease H-like domain-containing protein [Myxococcota bacterium]HQP95752.1 ribonuclease H-like domain-containing protein [Myxococcota bacterium]
MGGESKERIAELLKRKLDEIRERDGDLSGRRASRSPGAAHPAPGGVQVTRTGVDGAPPVQPPPLFGESFEPRARLAGVAAQARPITGDPGLNPFEELDRWRSMYRGQDVAGIMEGELGTVGRCGRPDLLEAVREIDASVPVIPRDQAIESIRSALWLLPGVRDRVAAGLGESGVRTVDALSDHARFGSTAARIERWISKGDVRRLSAQISMRGGAAHPLNLAVAAWYEPSDLLFIDIETGGLFGGSPVIVSGLAFVPFNAGASGNKVQVRVLVATDPDAEADLIAQTASAIADHPVLVSFNGRSFDFPYICQRAAFYGTPVRSDPLHLDLLGYSRRLWRDTATNCRLSTLAAEILGMRREHDIPGSLVPWFYEMYLKDPARNAGLVAAIAIHNSLDMEQTVRLYAEQVRLLLQGCASATPPDTLEEG